MGTSVSLVHAQSCPASLFSVGSHATDLSRDLCSGWAVGSALGMGICGSAGGRTGQGTKGAAMHWKQGLSGPTLSSAAGLSQSSHGDLALLSSAPERGCISARWVLRAEGNSEEGWSWSLQQPSSWQLGLRVSQSLRGTWECNVASSQALLLPEQAPSACRQPTWESESVRRGWRLTT